MEAGDLDRQITIERATKVTDQLGGVELSWSPIATVWASKTDVSDSERLRALEVGADIGTRFRIRWGLDVTVQDRVICDGRTYELSAVKEIGRHEGQELTGAARAE